MTGRYQLCDGHYTPARGGGKCCQKWTVVIESNAEIRYACTQHLAQVVGNMLESVRNVTVSR